MPFPWKVRDASSNGNYISSIVKPTFSFKERWYFKAVIDYKRDLSGRIINIKIKYKKQKLQIISLYVPDRPHLRENVFQNLKNDIYHDTPIIMGVGDFNMVEYSNKDRKGGKPSHTHKQGIVQLQYLKQDFDLEDKWRIENDKQQQYTWT